MIVLFRSRLRRFRQILLLLISLLLCISVTLAASSTNPAPRSSSGSSALTASPISLQQGWNKFISQRWEKASELARLEQTVEDYNADWIARSSSTGEAVKHRRLICLPLDDKFDPPMGMFSHKHVQTGDKMSLPGNFWQAINVNKAEVPWLFRVRRVDGVTSDRIEYNVDDDVITEYKPLSDLDSVVGGPLDFRAPSCYVFLPLWMMRALGLQPRDIVEVEQIGSVPAGSLAKLRPHSAEFAKDISNPQAVLETELRHYSSMTQGSTIAFDYNKKRYWFDVVELRSAPRGEKVDKIKVQDCDIATDFLPSKDVMLEQKKKRRQRLEKLKAEKQ